MNATLWDGTKQLHGQLDIKEKELSFTFIDFSQSSLSLKIQYENIVCVNLYRVFKIALEGLEIVAIDGSRNVFVLEESRKLKLIIDDKISKKLS